MNIMLFRGVLLGAGFSVATLVIFYRSVIAVAYRVLRVIFAA